MSYKKRVFAIILCVVFSLSSLVVPYAATVSKNGFTYDTSQYTVKWVAAQTIYITTDVGDILGKYTCYVGRARLNGYSNPYEDVLMFKMVMEPNEGVKCQTAFLKYGYGFSEYCSIKTTVPGTLGEYAPVNKPASDSITLQIGASKTGPQVSASYTVTKSQLDITANCSTSSNRFYEIYDYKPNLIAGSNKYLRYESQQYAMCQMDTTQKDYTVKVEMDGRFGAASGASISPLSIYKNYVKKKVSTVAFTFKN